jgi:hypothetical protein
LSWFSAAFRRPAFASRSSFARRGIRLSSRSAYRPNGRTSTGFPRSARMSSDRGGRPLYPEDGGAHPDRWRLTAGACRFAAASPCTRPYVPPAGFALNEASTRVQAIRPSGLPQPVAARMERAALGLLPRASHPAGQEPTTHAEVGTGHRARTWNHRSTHISVDLQSGSSLNTCDLASHVARALASFAPARTGMRSRERCEHQPPTCQRALPWAGLRLTPPTASHDCISRRSSRTADWRGKSPA